ncbi:heparan-alpha-glucosaminide N-acetyltransferase domain-containing protein [Wukongibacter baidiensis]|uniref:heparan-alpha-glucosaminide N-acetyltransferase domain-containing protein n=1 Tax=Wukongibacter baidiensis TaxID=1723361 RepID=UPI003D7F9FF4
MTEDKISLGVLTDDCDRYLGRKIKERNRTFDFIKGFAVFFMVIVHVLSTYSANNIQESFFGEVIDFLGGPPAAPVFMFSMGVFYILSSKSDSLKDGIIRGFKLLFLGCLLSFLRSDFLVLLNNNSVQVNYWDPNILFSIWEVDILQFAGWAYILMSLIKRYFKKPIWWLIIAVGIMGASPILWGISSDIKIVHWIFNFLWGEGDLVYFPIFPWLFYPLIGMIFGVYIKACSNIEELFKSFFRLGLVLFFIGSIVIITDYDFHVGDYYKSGPGLIIWITGFVFIWLWISNKIIQNIKESRFLNVIYYWGKETPSIYFIHWLLVSWGIIIFGEQQYGYLTTILLIGLILAASHFLSKVYKRV